MATAEERISLIERDLPLVEYRLRSIETTTPVAIQAVKDHAKDETARVTERVGKLEGDKNKIIAVIVLAVLSAVIKLVILPGGIPGV